MLVSRPPMDNHSSSSTVDMSVGVTFCLKPVIHTIPLVPTGDIDKVWFSKTDFQLMKRRDKALCHFIVKSKMENCEERRGLEPRLRENLERERRSNSLLVVLMEQERQQEEKVFSRQVIANLYTLACCASRKAARLLGAEDEKEAKTIYANRYQPLTIRMQPANRRWSDGASSSRAPEDPVLPTLPVQKRNSLSNAYASPCKPMKRTGISALLPSTLESSMFSPPPPPPPPQAGIGRPNLAVPRLDSAPKTPMRKSTPKIGKKQMLQSYTKKEGSRRGMINKSLSVKKRTAAKDLPEQERQEDRPSLLKSLSFKKDGSRRNLLKSLPFKKKQGRKVLEDELPANNLSPLKSLRREGSRRDLLLKSLSFMRLAAAKDDQTDACLSPTTTLAVKRDSSRRNILLKSLSFKKKLVTKEQPHETSEEKRSRAKCPYKNRSPSPYKERSKSPYKQRSRNPFRRQSAERIVETLPSPVPPCTF